MMLGLQFLLALAVMLLPLAIAVALLRPTFLLPKKFAQRRYLIAYTILWLMLVVLFYQLTKDRPPPYAGTPILPPINDWAKK